MNSSKEYFRLYAHCVPVKGYKRAIIYDLQRNDFEIIPNELYYFISSLENTKLPKIKAKHSNEERIILEGYIEFLLKKNFGFYLSEVERPYFTKLENYWDSYSLIQDCVIEITNNTYNYLDNIIELLERTQCENIALKIDSGNFILLQKFISALEGSIVNNIHVHADVDSSNNFTFWDNLVKQNKRISAVHIAIEEHTPKFSSINKKIFIHSKAVQNSISRFFKVNLNHFMEAQYHHTYFNRKLYISSEGEIKNSKKTILPLTMNLATHNTSTIIEFIKLKENQTYWNILKDNSEVCKDCEFRYMCLDNRTPIKSDESELWTFQVACEYNPYTGRWQEN